METSSELLPNSQPHCLWCGRAFTPRATGGSAQRFCCLEHRKAFWTAVRRWTMRAIETGLLSVECLKATQTSVHAAGGTLRGEERAGRGEIDDWPGKCRPRPLPDPSPLR